MDFSTLWNSWLSDYYALWNSRESIEWWRMLLIGLFLLLINFVIFIAMWYVRRSMAIEFGYPKRKEKAMKKKLSNYTAVDELLLIRITLEAERQGIFLYINLICHFANLAGFCSCIIGFLGSLVTLADGWALTLLVFSELGVLFITVLIEFIPHLIWIPSERARYKV